MTTVPFNQVEIFRNLSYAVLAGFTSKTVGADDLQPRGWNLGKLSEDLSVKENYQLLCELIGYSVTDISWMKQIHGNTILPACKGGLVGEGDGMFTTQTGLVLVVQTADCIPVLAAHRAKPLVSVVHAGWKGLQKNIHLELLRQWGDQGMDPHEFFFALGPHLKQCHFEVTDEFLEYFPSEYFLKIAGTWHFDATAYLISGLVNLGVPLNQIEVSDICTLCNPSYFSWRRNKTDGRQIGFIVIQKEDV